MQFVEQDSYMASAHASDRQKSWRLRDAPRNVPLRAALERNKALLPKLEKRRKKKDTRRLVNGMHAHSNLNIRPKVSHQ